jgi:hypothetical protein
MLKHSKLKKGERVSFTQYFQVEQVTKDGIIALDRDGQTIEIRGKELVEESFYSNSQYTQEIKAGKNELAGYLQSAGDKIFTVCFEKQDKTERILTGFYLSAETNLGRTKVVDLDLPKDDKSQGIRLVDNRTIKWLVIDQIKYIAQ